MIHNTQIPRGQQMSPFKTANFKQRQRSRSRSRSRSQNKSYVSNNSFSHNNSSIHSEYLWNALQQIQLFPTVCSQMLKHQQRNISEFKKSINRQKNRINTEMQSISVQINHIIEDYRLSLLSIMDRIYQSYISKYGQFKKQLLQIIRIKDQIQGMYSVRQEYPEPRSAKNISNVHTLKSMEISSAQIKRYQILNYIGELQKQKVIPVSQKAQQLLILSQYDNGFFQSQQFKNIIDSVKTGIRANFKQVYLESYSYIRDLDSIVFKQISRNNKPNDNIILQNQRDTPTLNQQNNPYLLKQRVRPPQEVILSQIPIRHANQHFIQHPQSFEFNYPNTERLTIPQNFYIPPPPKIVERSFNVAQSINQPQNFMYSDDSDIQKMQSESNSYLVSKDRNQSNYSNLYSIENKKKINNRVEQNFHSQHFYYHPQVIVSPQKIGINSIKISQQNPFSFKSRSPDVILCSLFIDDNLIAVGNKDGSLYFYDRSGNIVKAHHNVHKSSICTLQLINDGQYLATGSDHPNPQIILWSLSSYQFEPFCRLNEHKGAVTAIQCLQDNEHMISGSYDKKLCVYSFHERKLKYTLPSNKSSVTALNLNSNGSKLISCCLENNALNIWQIVRSNNMDGLSKVETIFLQQVVESNTMLCSVVTSAVQPNIIYIGTKDGRLKIVDIDKGEAIKNMSCCNNALIQMLIIEQPGALPLILCWPCKQKCFKMVDCETGRVTNINTRCQLDFGCGVGPKASATKNGSGFIVCSQSDDREIYWYKINRAV